MRTILCRTRNDPHKFFLSDTLSMRKEKFMGVVSCPAKNSPHYRLDIEFVHPNSYGAALLYFTGSKEFNVMMRANAKKRGFLLNEHGLYYAKTGKVVRNCMTEQEIFAE